MVLSIMIPHFSDNSSGGSASHAGCPPGCLNGHSFHLLPNIAAIRGEVMGHPHGLPHEQVYTYYTI